MHTRVPRSIVLAAASNGVMLVIFATVLLLFGGPLELSASSTALPIVDVVYRTTGSKGATTALMALLMVVFFAATFNMFASVSRLVWAFSRDGGLPGEKFFAYVSRWVFGEVQDWLYAAGRSADFCCGSRCIQRLRSRCTPSC